MSGGSGRNRAYEPVEGTITKSLQGYGLSESMHSRSKFPDRVRDSHLNSQTDDFRGC